MKYYLLEEYGNAASRTHIYGNNAKKAVERAKDHIANIVQAKREEVILTSGATESDNLAILGLAEYGKESGKKHVISTQIEHKAVLEPLAFLETQGFEVTLVSPTSGGWVEPEAIQNALQDDTLLVSVMHANNETGVIQPLDQVADVIKDHSCYFHTDAAQGYGKELQLLTNQRIDMISISGHKVYAPKGIGALICRRKNYKLPPLQPLMYGGGHQRGLRPGTLPVHLIVGLGKAAELAAKESQQWANKCKAFKDQLLKELEPLKPTINGDLEQTMPNAVNLSFEGLDSEAVILALKDEVAISNGSACTSSSYEPSHVLKAMGYQDSRILSALRWSWSFFTEEPDWEKIRRELNQMY